MTVETELGALRCCFEAGTGDMTGEAPPLQRLMLYGIKEFLAPPGYGMGIMAEIAASLFDRKAAVARFECRVIGIVTVQAERGSGFYQELVVP